MNIGEQLEAEWRAAEHSAAEAMRHLMHHGTPQPAAQAIPHNETEPPQREETPMSLFAEVKNDFATVAAKIAAIDEEAIRLAEQIAQIPGAKELVGALIATLGVSPQLVSTFTALATDIGQAVPVPVPAEPTPA